MASGTLAGVVTPAVDQLAVAVDANVRLHSEVPLIALPRLMHLGISRLLGILVSEGVLMIVASKIVLVAYLQALGRRVPLHLIEQAPAPDRGVSGR